MAAIALPSAGGMPSDCFRRAVVGLKLETSPFGSHWLHDRAPGGVVGTRPARISRLRGRQNLATVKFAEDLTRLRSLNLSDTAVSDVELRENKSLAKLDVSRTKVCDLSYFGAENLEELNVSHTMVESLAPLWKLKRLREITAAYSTVNKLPRRPMPALQDLTVVSTPLSQASIDAFAKRNPKCVVSRRPEQWRRRLAGATRLRIRTGGANYSQYYELMPYLFPGKTLFEITDPARIRELVRLFESQRKGPRCLRLDQ